MDENKWEYNYSSSDNTAGGTGYPNVGSSGMNTANQYNNEPEPQAAAPAFLIKYFCTARYLSFR